MKISRCAALKVKNPIRKRLIYFLRRRLSLSRKKIERFRPSLSLNFDMRSSVHSRPGAREDRDAFADSPFNRYKANFSQGLHVVAWSGAWFKRPKTRTEGLLATLHSKYIFWDSWDNIFSSEEWRIRLQRKKTYTKRATKNATQRKEYQACSENLQQFSNSH